MAVLFVDVPAFEVDVTLLVDAALEADVDLEVDADLGVDETAFELEKEEVVVVAKISFCAPSENPYRELYVGGSSVYA